MSLFYLPLFLRRGLWLYGAALALAVGCVGTARAADPGTILPSDAGISDQKPGSVLVYVVYTSSASAPGQQNTRVNMTNTSLVSGVAAHIFFITDSAGTVADSFICLTASQTASFLISDVDPGVTGYIVVIAIDGANGCPIGFNNLTGDEDIKFTSGHIGKLNAVALAAGYSGLLAGCNNNSISATLSFNGTSSGYDQLPRVLVADKILSPAEGNNSLFFLMRFGGNFNVPQGVGGGSSIGALTGFLYDDSGNQYPFTLTTNNRLFQATFSDGFPGTTPNLSTIIPPSRRGWVKIYSTGDAGLLGAVLNYNPNSSTTRTAFGGSQSLHTLTLSTSNSITIPVFPPSC